MVAVHRWDVSQEADHRGLQHALYLPHPLSVRLTGFATAADSRQTLERALRVVAETANQQFADTKQIVIGIDADGICPRYAWQRRVALLGAGSMVFFLSDAFVDPLSANGERRETWHALWSLRDEPQIRIAYANWVTSPSPVLMAEKANAVLPPSYLQIPDDSAWCSTTIDLSNCVQRQRVVMSTIDEQLQAAITSSDRAHDLSRWTSPRMREDSLINRRLAIHLKGIGDLVRLLRWDPQALATLRSLHNLLASIKQRASSHSAAIARRRGSLPCIAAPGMRSGSQWMLKWREALAGRELAHRNLLVIAPEAILPTESRSVRRYHDLLPVLAHTDACTAPPVALSSTWNFNDFKQFHSRAWAVLDRRCGNSSIAETP